MSAISDLKIIQLNFLTDIIQERKGHSPVWENLLGLITRE